MTVRTCLSRLSVPSYWMAACVTLTAGGMQAAPQPATSPPVPHAWSTKLINIAAAANGGRILSVSSTLDHDEKNFAAANLIDGKVYNPQTRTGSQGWVSDKYDPINMEYVIIAFKDNAVKNIGKFVIDPAAAVTPERWAKDVSIEVSTDTAEGPYRPVAELTLLPRAQKQEFTILPAAARFVKLQFRTNYGSDRAVALGEVEIYEAINPTDPLGDVISRMEGAVNELKQFRQNQLDIGSTGTGLAALPAGVHDAALAGGAPAAPAELSPATLQLIDAQVSETAATGTANAAPRNTSPAARATADTAAAAKDIALTANGGKIVDYSSIFQTEAGTPDPAYKPENLISGQPPFDFQSQKGVFGWASQGFAPGQQWVTIGFANDRTHVVNKVVMNPVSNQPVPRWARRIDIQVTTGSAKSGPWRTVATANLRMQPVPQDFQFPSVEARYVKFVFLANGPGDVHLPGINPDVNSDRSVSLGRIEIYEPVIASAALDALIGHFEQILIDLKRIYDTKEQAPAA